MDPPSLTLTDTAGCEAKKTVKFQCGLLRETETFMGEELELLCRDTLLDYACDMLNSKVTWIVTEPLAGWLEPASTNILVCVCV